MLLTIEEPMWTDVWQTIAALIGIPATIVGFIILFIKDRNKENQIQKLSEIASHLSKMAVDSENRYIHTRRPIFDIEVIRLGKKRLQLIFKNRNLNSIVKEYNITNLNPDSYIRWASDVNSQFQVFKIDLDSELGSPHDGAQILEMKYRMIEGYVFDQVLGLKSTLGKLKVTQLSIKFNNEASKTMD